MKRRLPFTRAHRAWAQNGGSGCGLNVGVTAGRTDAVELADGAGAELVAEAEAEGKIGAADGNSDGAMGADCALLAAAVGTTALDAAGAGLPSSSRSVTTSIPTAATSASVDAASNINGQRRGGWGCVASATGRGGGGPANGAVVVVTADAGGGCHGLRAAVRMGASISGSIFSVPPRMFSAPAGGCTVGGSG